MIKNCTFLFSLFILHFSLFSPNVTEAQDVSPADTFNITGSCLHYPNIPVKWQFRWSAGLLLVKPPMDLLENNYQGPLGNFHATFGLPWKLSLEGDVSTIIVSNQVSAGPHISFNFGKLGLKAGWDVAYSFGQLKQFGFDNSSKIWMHYPTVSIGMRSKTMAFTLKSEVVFVTRISQMTGENEVVRSNNFFNGVTNAVYIEQRLWKNHVFVFGLKDNYEKFYWPVWMMFTTFNRFYHIPELSFTWII